MLEGITSRDEFLKHAFDTSEEEINRQLIFPNLCNWVSTKMTHNQLIKLIKGSPYLSNSNPFKKKYVALKFLFGYYNGKKTDRLTVECAQRIINDYLEQQLGYNEYACTMYEIETLLKCDMIHADGVIATNNLQTSLDEFGSHTTGFVCLKNNSQMLYHLFKHFGKSFCKVFKAFENRIFILKDELLCSAIMADALTEKQLLFMMDFVIGHERGHLASGKAASQYKYIAKNWHGGYDLSHTDPITEQMADRAGLIYAIKKFYERRREYISNLY